VTLKAYVSNQHPRVFQTSSSSESLHAQRSHGQEESPLRAHLLRPLAVGGRGISHGEYSVLYIHDAMKSIFVRHPKSIHLEIHSWTSQACGERTPLFIPYSPCFIHARQSPPVPGTCELPHPYPSFASGASMWILVFFVLPCWLYCCNNRKGP
jgi:hypothetical protein